MEKDDAPAYITVALDRGTLATVVDVFLQMVEQRDEIDFGMMDLEPFEKFEALLERLISYRDSGDSIAIIPMSRDEWSTYTPYVHHANDLVLDDHEGCLMADLRIRYARVNTAATLPSGPV